MSIALATLVDLTEKVIAQARDSDEVFAIMGCDDDLSSQEKEIYFLSSLARSLRKQGIEVRSMTREATFHNKFDSQATTFEVPIYHLRFEGVDFASHGLCGSQQIRDGMGLLIDTDHHGMAFVGWGGAHDISHAEDADPQEDLHDWFDQNSGAFLANEQAQTISRRTPTKSASKKPRSRI